METQKELLMRTLDCSAEEADDIIAYDKLVDQGKPTPYDLTKEQQKVAKDMTIAKKHTVYNFQKRERKANPTKADLIKFLANALGEYDCQNLEIVNDERLIAFGVGENKYELTLTQKRAKK